MNGWKWPWNGKVRTERLREVQSRRGPGQVVNVGGRRLRARRQRERELREVYDKYGWWGAAYDVETLGSLVLLGRTLDDPGVAKLYSGQRKRQKLAREVDDELLLTGIDALDGGARPDREWLLGLTRDEYADLRDAVGDANRTMVDPWWVLKETLALELKRQGIKLTDSQEAELVNHVERVRSGRWERLLFRRGRQG